MKRFAGLALLCAGLATALLLWGRRGPTPSVLLVTIDTLRADRVGAYGSTAGATPRLDALASAGTLFETALSPVPLTLPAHATLLSGLEPPRHGARDNGLYVVGDDVATLATLLRPRGFATAAFVGAYVLDRRFGLARGFETYDDALDRRAREGSTLEAERRCDLVAAAARSWLARAEGRFAAWVHFYDPHAPYDPPADLAGRYPGPYEAEVAAADRCLGTVVDAARARAGDALVIAVTSDHGEALGEHGERTHGFFVYDATLRVPLVLSGAGVPRGERRAGVARAADLLPTLLARLGEPSPAGLDGVDLFSGAPRQEAYAETLYPRSLGFSPLFSLRVGRHKWIRAPRGELYDVERDPGETRNLADDPTLADVRARLDAALDRALAAQRDGAAAADPAVAERLRALGYVAGAPGSEAAAPATDPKDGLHAWRRVEDAVASEARGEMAEAIRSLQAAVAERPDNAALARLLAGALRRSGRALDAADALSTHDVPDPLFWHERALALAAADRVDAALEAEDRALALGPSLPELHNHRGVLLARRGQPAAALAAFDHAIALDPNGARAWANRGNALRELGRVAEARAAYERAAALSPSDPEPLNGLGVLAVLAGDAEAGAAYFERVVAADPEHAEARLNLAIARLTQGRLEAARPLLDEVCRGRQTPVQRRACDLRAGLPPPQ